jgi:hypothetical protein
MKQHSKLHSLAARLDSRLKHFTDDADQRAAQTMVGGAAAGAAGYGAFRGGKAIRNKVINSAGAVDDYGKLVARKGMYKKAGAQAIEASKKKIKSLPGAAKGQLRDAAGNVMAKSSSLLRKAASGISKGRGKMYGLAAQDGERNIGRDGAIAVGAGAAGYGAYRGGKAYAGNLKLRRVVGDSIPGNEYVDAAKQTGRDAKRAVQSGYGKAKSSVQSGYTSAKKGVQSGYGSMKDPAFRAGLKGKAMKGGRDILEKSKGGIMKVIGKGRKLVGLSSLENAVHELSSRLEGRNFGTPYTEHIKRTKESGEKLNRDSYFGANIRR